MLLLRGRDLKPCCGDQAGNIRTAAGLVRQHHRDFSPLASCSEAERDRIEAEVGGYLKACAANVARLEASVPAVNGVANATAVAHQHGVVRGRALRARHMLRCWMRSGRIVAAG